MSPHSLASRETAVDAIDGELRELQREGRDFLFALYAADRALRLYPIDNRAVQNAVRELTGAAERLLEREPQLVLRFVGDLCFLNDVRLRVDLGNYAAFGGVGRLLRKHGAGQLEATVGVTREQWIAALCLLAREPDAEDAFGGIRERLERASVHHIDLGRLGERETQRREAPSESEVARRTYAFTVAAAREVMGGARMGRAVSFRGVKRAVQCIVDQVLDNETSMLGMTVLRDHDEYTFRHSVNVCIFSIALGKKLGFDKRQLYELGLGALLHDIGKLDMPMEVINKTGTLSDEEWRLMQEHPSEGLLKLLEMRGQSSLPLRTVLLAYEHHMKGDLTGYPRSYRPRESHLFARIVAIADAFDAATSQRAYQQRPRLPDAVLKEMRDEPRFAHDPLLVKAFISMTGIYPVGTLAVLDSYELAVVIGRNPREECVHLPIVKVIFDDLGLPLDPPPVLDLAEPDPRTGNPFRTIIKTTDPERYGIDVSRYLF